MCDHIMNIFSTIRGCLVSKSPRKLSFENYNYSNSITMQEWKQNIKTVYSCTNLPWLSPYDDMIEDIYHNYKKDIPFHNHQHVYDVFQMGVLLLTRNFNTFCKLTEIEIFTFCIALLCHDIDHKGLTNCDIAADSSIYDDDIDEEVTRIDSTGSLSSMCSTESYNERHHIFLGKKLLRKHNIEYDEILFEKLISFTDLIVHNKFMEHSEFMNVDPVSNNHNTLILLMKLADIGHILRPWEIHLEFVSSMNKERSVPLKKELLPKDTIQFNDKFMLPLIEKLKEVNIGLYHVLLKLYYKNIDRWKTELLF